MNARRACRQLIALLLLMAVAMQAQGSTPWLAQGGHLELELRGDYLPDFGLEIDIDGQRLDRHATFDFALDSIEPLRLSAPFGHLQAVEPGIGGLQWATDLVFRHAGRRVSLESLVLTPSERNGHPVLLARDAQGEVLLQFSHLHIHTEPLDGRLVIRNADVEFGAALAERLGLPQLAGHPLGLAALTLDLEVPPDADLVGQPAACDARPIWPQDGVFEAEVALIDMNNVAYQGIEPGTGRIKIAPSATLKNISQADIPWFPQFSNPAIYPFEPADQHPFLVWNLYRIHQGRMEMLAQSGVKHAFFTINVNCDINCNNGNILWPGCEDIYSAGNNDTSVYQGPREEIVASQGLWDSCGSFFDPDCSGSQTGFAGQWLNRLLVNPAELQTPGARYFIDAWYVIQNDRNIWSSMGYREIFPSPLGSGWVFDPGTFQQGPVINEWVAENGSESGGSHRQIVIASQTPSAPYPGNLPQGHLRVLVRVAPTENGRYRYRYAVQNYDFERGMNGFHLVLPSGAVVFDHHVGVGPDANGWSLVSTATGVSFLPPIGQFQPWFTLYNFEIETDVPPAIGEVYLGLVNPDQDERVAVSMLAPSLRGETFADRFAEGD